MLGKWFFGNFAGFLKRGMMMDTIFSASFVVLAAVVLGGIQIGKKVYPLGTFFVGLGLIFQFLVVDVSMKHGIKPLTTLVGETYVVHYVGKDVAGKSIQLLYEVKNDRSRIANLDVFPPSGYKEVVTVDGQKLLIPMTPTPVFPK